MAYEKSILKVYTVTLTPNYLQPHATSIMSEATGSGFVAQYRGQKIIVTNAHVVVRSNDIQVKLTSDSTKYEARLIEMDDACDLALLTVDDPKFWEEAVPLEFVDVPPRTGSEIGVAGCPDKEDNCVYTDGTIAVTDIMSYSLASSLLLATQVSATISPGSSGGPVLYNGKVGWIKLSDLSGTEGTSTGFTFTQKTITSGKTPHTIQIIQFGNTEKLTAEQDKMVQQMKAQQDALQKDMQKMMNDVFKNADQQWMHFPMVIPVIVVPEQKLSEQKIDQKKPAVTTPVKKN
jgi:hypothetical protein